TRGWRRSGCRGNPRARPSEAALGSFSWPYERRGPPKVRLFADLGAGLAEELLDRGELPELLELVALHGGLVPFGVAPQERLQFLQRRLALPGDRQHGNPEIPS